MLLYYTVRASLRTACVAAALLLTCQVAKTQDNILVYGNSIIFSPAIDYLGDLIIESGRPTPNIVQQVAGNQTTNTYVNQLGVISSSLPSNQTWKAAIVCGGTLETTNFMGNAAAFQANMLTIANAFYAHSPQGLFIGHETGADHPNSTRYPSWFADAATWLAFPQAAYAQAEAAITAAHPNSPPAQTAHQGTCFANTVGYGLGVYQNDLHHLSNTGKLLVACLYYIEIYGGRIEDLNVDFASSTPLVTRLLNTNIDENRWNRIVGFADRSQPRSQRPYPGSDSDFQMRTGFASNFTDLRSTKQANVGDSVYFRLMSPLGATETHPAGVYMQVLPTGTAPSLGTFPGLQLNRALLSTWFAIPDLAGTPIIQTIPAGLSGMTIWIQAASRGPSGSSQFPLTLSDAQRIEVQ